MLKQFNVSIDVDFEVVSSSVALIHPMVADYIEDKSNLGCLTIVDFPINDRIFDNKNTAEILACIEGVVPFKRAVRENGVEIFVGEYQGSKAIIGVCYLEDGANITLIVENYGDVVWNTK